MTVLDVRSICPTFIDVVKKSNEIMASYDLEGRYYKRLPGKPERYDNEHVCELVAYDDILLIVIDKS